MSEGQRREVYERCAEIVCSRRLEVPAIFLLEMCKPIAGLMNAVLTSFLPFLLMIMEKENVQALLHCCREREDIELLLQLIEERVHGS